MSRRFPPGIPGLLQSLMWIQRGRATGSLEPVGGSGAGRLWFRDGILLRAESATGEPLDDATDELRQRAHDIASAWCGGDALLIFSEGTDAGAPEPQAGKLNAGDLILDLVRREADPQWIRRRLGDPSGSVSNPETLPALLPMISMTPADSYLLSRADGTMSLGDILASAPEGEMDSARSLFGLLAVGLLVAPGALLPGERSASPAPAPEDPSAAAPAPPLREAAGPPPQAAGSPIPPGPAPGRGDGAGAASPPPARTASALDDFLARTASLPKAPAGRTGPPSAPEARAAEGPPPSSAPPPAPARVPAPPTRGAAAGVAAAAAGADAQAPEADRLRAEVLEWIAESAGGNHYAILRIDRGSGEDDIRRAYYRLAKKFHPDKFRRQGFEGLLPDVERMFAKTTEAYNTLTDDRARAEYEKEMAERARGGRPGGEQDLAAQGRESFLRAKKHIEAGEWFDAASLLEAACRVDPGKREYWLALGTVQEKNPKWRRKAEESYLKAVEIDSASADAYLHLARLYKAGGLGRRAAEMYRKVFEWDPENEEAAAALAGGPAPQGPGKGGRLKSIFKGSRG